MECSHLIISSVIFVLAQSVVIKMIGTPLFSVIERSSSGPEETSPCLSKLQTAGKRLQYRPLCQEHEGVEFSRHALPPLYSAAPVD